MFHRTRWRFPMSLLDSWTSSALILFNVLVYSALAYQLFSRPRRRFRAPTISDAFRELAAVLLASIPGLPNGFTLREGVERAKSSGIDADWSRVEDALSDYESI